MAIQSSAQILDPRLETGSPIGRPARAGLGRTVALRLVIAALLVALGYLVLAPMIQLMSQAFADGGAGFRQAWSLPGLRQILLRTVYLAFGSVVVAMGCGVALAVSAYHLPRRGRRFFEMIPVIPLMIPSVALVTGWAFLLSPSVGYVNTLLRQIPLWQDARSGPIDVYSVPWIVIIVGFSLSSFVFTFVFAGLRRVDRELPAAAAVSGLSPAAIWWRILLPLVRPSLLYSGIIVFVLALGQFAAPLLLGRTKGIDVVSTAMFRSINAFPAQFGAASALGVPIIACILLLTPFQRRLLRQQDRFVVIGGKGARSDTDDRRWAPVVIGIYGVVAVALPVLGLVYVSLSPFWTAQLSFGDLTLRNFRTIFQDSLVTSAIFNTLASAALAIVVLLAVGFVVSKALTDDGMVSTSIRRILDLLVSLPLTIPGVIFGLGFLLAYTGGPINLYGSWIIFTVAFVTLFLPHAVRLISTARSAISKEFAEAAAVSGASPWRRALRIELPMMRPALSAAALLIFILSVHEFAAALMVRTDNNQVLGTILYDYWSSGTYPQVAAVAVLMTAMTIAGAACIGVLSGRDSTHQRRGGGLETLSGGLT